MVDFLSESHSKTAFFKSVWFSFPKVFIFVKLAEGVNKNSKKKKKKKKYIYIYIDSEIVFDITGSIKVFIMNIT